ncbi:alpha/beta hydrolase [Bacillus sp. EB01]|uniref:alpha/beta hydrolase n=1 Tax=Bacillus sp. EB01 TaxID=1347086 RepID=UPI0005C6AE63|nr:alpha/beta fold hydrolase [Bacillus sp. EB01]
MYYKVIDGAEAFYMESGEIGIVLCHGFNGTPQSVREVGEMLWQKGFTVYAPRLNGHGTHYLDMEQYDYKDWLTSVKEAISFLQKNCTQVYVAGQSMGGASALYCAASIPGIDGIITINAALDIPCYETEANSKQRYIPEGKPDIKAQDVYEIAYELVPRSAIKNLLALSKEAKSKLGRVTCPALIIKSKIDNVVPPYSSDFAFATIASKIKKLVTLENSYHVATMDNDKGIIADEIASFIAATSEESVVNCLKTDTEHVN